ncbi:MAG: glutamate mutase L [Armatimonadetes bacterium]|nr:glutamate mutase L [Armatimonadota bacterium]
MSDNVRSILATDCGSTTTKAILIEKLGDEYRLRFRGEAPTTVEAPFDDVTIGVLNAVSEVEELSGRTLVDSGRIIVPQQDEKTGVDLYLSTSSAGGGLQMMVMGVVRQMSAESGQRAALGAGAIIMDTIAIDDGRKDYQKIERLRALRPDIVLMSGGTDGGTVTHLVDLAELLLSADPRPRFGTMNLPVIYAGNKDAVEPVTEISEKRFDVRVVNNLRPTLDKEDLGPAREAVHELFLEHVMQQAPGYGKLMTWTSADIMSTPNAVGKIMVTIAEQRGINILGVDIGGATTDVFSVFHGNYTRTVSANLGMSYSICNVMLETGIENIRRWLPFDIDPMEVRNRLRNKMIRPTTIPQTYHDLLLEQAAAREALRLAFIHHKDLARGLKGIQQQRTIGDALDQKDTGETLVNLMELDMIVGSGGVLSHAPERAQSALMVLDAYQPEGVTMLAVDSIFMMPQLGVLSTVHPVAAAQVFDRDCLIRLGHSVCPVGQGKEGELCMTVDLAGQSVSVSVGEIKVVPLGVGEKVKAVIKPNKNFDVGEGKGRTREMELEGGVVGLVFDGRGRPMVLPTENDQRTKKLKEWLAAFNLPMP